MTYIALCKGRRILVEAVDPIDAKKKAQKILREKTYHSIVIMVPEQPHQGQKS